MPFPEALVRLASRDDKGRVVSQCPRCHSDMLVLGTYYGARAICCNTRWTMLHTETEWHGEPR